MRNQYREGGLPKKGGGGGLGQFLDVRGLSKKERRYHNAYYAFMILLIPHVLEKSGSQVRWVWSGMPRHA